MRKCVVPVAHRQGFRVLYVIEFAKTCKQALEAHANADKPIKNGTLIQADMHLNLPKKTSRTA
jgi:hypothetical protein